MASEKYREIDIAVGIRKLMKEKKVTQVEIAKAVGVSQASVSGWLNGSVPNGILLQRLADFLGVSVIDILRRPEANPIYEAAKNAMRVIPGVVEEAEARYAALTRSVRESKPAVRDDLYKEIRGDLEDLKTKLDAVIKKLPGAESEPSDST